QTAADDQAQTSTTPGQMVGAFSLSKGFEQALLVIFANTNSRVLNLQLHLNLLWFFGGLYIDPNLDLTVFGKFDRVADQIAQYLFETQRINQCIGLLNIRIEFQ